MTHSGVTYRDLTTLEDFALVVDLERRIWGPGYDDVVPLPILAVTVHRGGVLIGAFAGERMIGFVYSLPGIKHGKATQWSHMLGVLDEFRRDGIGYQLKLLQRDRTLAMGLDLIEWTYDPLQATNAHLNFAKLGVIACEYLENVYGESASPLHQGNPTDRFVAEWHIREPRRSIPVEVEMAGAVAVNGTEWIDGWLESIDVDLSVDAPALTVEIPMCFTDMLARAPEHAMEWRICSRAVFTTYFDRGYCASGFALDREGKKGRYLLTRSAAPRADRSASRAAPE
jgi:predicted GNAT superfamily acetyltransferase